MKTRIYSILAAAGCSLLMAGAAAAGGPPAVSVFGNATVDSETVILDIFADVSGTELRSFGINVVYDRSTLSPTAMVRHSRVWYLSKPNGDHVPYDGPELIDEKRIRIVGGHLDGRDPMAGVQGGRILLGTITFERLEMETPKFGLELASPSPFANFVSVSGDRLDASVEGLGDSSVQMQEAPEDSDEDGLPDNYELEVFGALGVSDGSSDSDGDGNSDREEWLGGTDPTDAGSNISIELVQQPNGELVARWTSVEGRVYTLEHTTDFDSFTPLFEGMAGIPPMDKRPVPLMERGYFRLIMTNPTAGR